MLGLMQNYPLTIQTVLRRASRHFPDKRIVLAAGKPEETTWGAVGERARRLSNALRRRGIKNGSMVGSFAWNTPRHLELYFAVPCLGAVLHTINVRLHEDQILAQVQEAGDSIIFVDASLTDRLASVKARLDDAVQFVIFDDGGEIDPAFTDSLSIEDFIEREVDTIEYPELDENTAAVLCYTGGTTGTAKGVLYSHRSEVLHAFSALSVDAFAISERDVILLAAPMFHANGWGMPYAAALAGASLIFTGRDTNPDTLIRVLDTEQVTLAAGVPTVWIGVDNALRNNGIRLESLRRILIGGAAPSEDLIEGFRQRGVSILQGWGMTETSPNASIARIDSFHAASSAATQTHLRATQGIAGPGVEVRICDDNGNELLWDGEAVGELEVRGPWIVQEYFPAIRHDAKNDRFHNGWLRTGDVATIDHYGYIRILDRLKDAIKSGGEWISSVELESQLASHPAVQEAAVVALPDPKWGERPAALIVLKPGCAATEKELIAHLTQVPRWWIPEIFRFCAAIPKTSVGKYDKKRIRADWGNAA